jgi:transcriptional regulator with XRE-family HTH domain
MEEFYMITEEFHKRLIQLLKDKNISQKKLVDGIGVTEATISRYVKSVATKEVNYE